MKNLETDRLLLRKIRLEDAESMYNNWANDKEVCKYVVWDVHKSIDDTKKIIEKWILEYEKEDTYRWIVTLKETKEAIGTIDVVHFHKRDNTAEIGYCYGSKYWNKGYATEALKAVIQYLHEEGIDVITAEHMASNPASGRVMQKAGMTYEATLKSRMYNKEGKREDLCVYSSIIE